MDHLSRKELDTLARLAHDLGFEAATNQECNQDRIEQVGKDTLTRLKSLLGTEQIGRLFAANFYRGWHFAQTDSREWEERRINL